MAILVGQQMDFQRLQALNLVFHSSANASPPSTPVEGQPWWVTDTDVMKVYNGAAWNTVVIGPASSTDGRVPKWNGTSGGQLLDGYDVVTTVGDPGADTALPTEQAVREAIAAALSSEVTWKGGYDAATNTPDLDVSPTGVKKGDMYYVTAAGTFFSTPLETGDVIIANIDNADAEAEWTMIQKNLPAIIPVANGGTGNNTFTAYSLIASGTTATGAFTQIAETTQYKILFSGTVSAYPTWSPYTMPSTVAAYAMFYASSSSAVTTLANGGTTGTFLRNTNGAAPAWSTLVLPNALVQWGMLYAGTADNYTGVIAAATVTGSFLRGTSGGAPAWGAVAYPNSAAIGDLLYASTTTAISGLTAVAAGSYLRSAGVNTAPVWSTLILPNASTRGDLLRGATTANNITVLALGTAGKLLRSDGSDPTWSTVTMPDTLAALGVFVTNTANTMVALAGGTALQSIRINSGATAWEWYTPTGGGNHNILDGSTHSDSVAGTVARGTLIVGNSTPKWSLLAFQASGASGYVLATDSADTGWKKQRYVEKLSTSATSYDIVHNLGTRRVMVLCQDTTNNQNILIDWNCKSGAENTTVTVYFGSAPSANTRIITVFGINFGNALDTAN